MHKDIELNGVIQDGPNFYYDDDPLANHNELILIVSYPDMVAHDNDLIGALKARERFAREYPQFTAE